VSKGEGLRDFFLQPGGFQDRRHAAGHRQGAAGDALEVTNVLPGGINLCDRPLAAADRGGSGYSAPYRGSADI